jgi:DNA-binding winged helix-turn-helix (wHTH) protein/serine/threonine protein kinase
MAFLPKARTPSIHQVSVTECYRLGAVGPQSAQSPPVCPDGILKNFLRNSKSMVLNVSAAGPAEAAGRVWTFDGRQFDESRLELRVGGSLVELELKPLEVLVQLLQHAGEVVTKDGLLEAVWPGLSVVDGSLSTAVHKLRKALGDNDSTVVVTVPRVGYRLTAAARSNPARPSPFPAELSFKAGQPVPGREHWRLARPLDASPKSEVWLAEHPKTRELRVFKFVSNAGSLKALKREVTVFRFLRESLGERPDFVRTFEWNFAQQPYFLESEYGGPNLSSWAEAQGGLAGIPLRKRVEMVAAIAETVAAAHGAGVLHKDLKPANVLVTPAPDSGGQIKLADFGSASLLEPSRLKALGITSLGLTQTGIPQSPSLTGTLMYLAPEVLSGKSPTALADVYALGVILYQAVTGDFRKPLSEGWEDEVGDPLIREDIAASVCGDPARRLASAAELARRLRDLEQRRIERARLEEARQRKQIAERRRAEARARRPLWAVLATMAVLILAVTLCLRTRSSPSAPLLKSVAVLPLQNAGSDHSFDFLGQAVPDEIATSLSYARSLSVRSFSVTSKYNRPDLDLQKAGDELHVSSIVSGHFIKEGDDLELALEAMDVKTGRVFWRDTLTVPARSMIELREKLIARTQGTLAAALGASAFTVDAGTRPTSEQAYELYLRAAAIPLDTARNKQAVAMLEQSVGMDSSFAPAWLMLGRKYYVEARYVGGGSAMVERANAAERRALSLDPDYAAAAANVIGWYVESGNLPKAVEESEELLRRHPDSADAHYMLSYALRFAGLLEESGNECETAFRLDPHTQTSGLRSCAIVFAQRGNYRRAVDYLNLDPTSDFAKAILLTTRLREGKTKEALKIGPPHIPQWGSYDMLPACIQRRSPQEIAALAANVQTSEDPEANYLAAANLAYCGQNKEALRLLGLAVQGNYCSYPAMDSDPFFASLRTMPEFAEIRAAGIACQKRFLTERQHLQQAHK